MSKEKNVSINIFDLIDSVCREFRGEWKKGNRPRINTYLNSVPKNAQANLFHNLLEAEIRYRRRLGESPTSSEYIKSYPEFGSQVRQAFDESTMGPLHEFEKGAGSSNDPAELTQSFDFQGASRLGDYELLDELGRGGFGVVYGARHIKRNHRVALKTLPTGADGQEINAERLHKFRKEFRSLSEINHPNLIGMQTLEVDGDQWFFTMDLIEGEDFLSYVRPLGKLDEPRLRSSLKQLAAGIVALHELGIVHRDLKPSNVMVQPDGHVVILDFGLVSHLQSHTDMTLTKSGMFVGTPKYAAPEQMFGERSEASDWYALGTILYEALDGAPPFTGSPMDIMRNKQTEDPPSIAAGKLPEDLSQLADNLLKREPQLRLTTPEIMSALELDVATKNFGSTHGSSAASGSTDEMNYDSEALRDEEIILIGRDEQLTQLENAKQDFLKNREPNVVWVSGKSGEGKSSLVEKFLQPLRLGEEVLVLSGRCYDRESVPFKAIDSTIDVLGSFLRSITPELYQDAVSSNTPLLSRIFPVLKRVEAIAKAPQPDTREMTARQLQLRGFDALRDLWSVIGNSTPIVLFIDDLQWADADSAEMLWEMLGGSTAPAVMLIGSYRSDEAEQSSFLRKWQEIEQKRTADLVRQPMPSQEIHVDRLSIEQCLEFLECQTGVPRETLPPALIKLSEESAGNPYILEVLAESQQDGDEFQQIDLAELIRRRLQKLPNESTDLLEAVAIAGQAVEFDEVVATAGLESSALGTLTHMRNEKLVRLVGSQNNHRVDTWHDKVREIVLAQLPKERRKGLHLRLANHLEQKEIESSERAPLSISQHPRLYDLAYHFGEADDPRAFEYQLEAGLEALKTNAIEESLEYLHLARARLPSDSEKVTCFKLYLGLSEAELGMGRLDTSRGLAEQAITYAENDFQKACCRAGMANSWMRRGDLVAARDEFYETVRLLGYPEPKTLFGKVTSILVSQFKLMFVPPWLVPRLWKKEESEEAKVLYAEIGTEFKYALTTDFPSFAAYVLSLGARAKHSRVQEELAFGYLTYAEFLAMGGLSRLAKRFLKISIAKREYCENQSLLESLDYVIGSAYYYLGQLDEAERQLESLRSSFIHKRSRMLGYCYHWLRHVNSIRGNSRRVIWWARKELDYARQTDDLILTSYGLYGLADGYSRVGKFEEAIEMARLSGEKLRSGKSDVCYVADQELGRALLQASQYEEARNVLGPARKAVVRKLMIVELFLDIYPLLTEAILGVEWIQVGRQGDKRRIKEACSMARKSRFYCLKFPTIKPHALRVSGRAANAAGKEQKALKYFDKAIVAAEKIGAHFEQARSLIDKSMLDYPDSGADRQRGIELLESLGCVLPDAELEYLNIDRAKHHAQAAAAREKEEQVLAAMN